MWKVCLGVGEVGGQDAIELAETLEFRARQSTQAAPLRLDQQGLQLLPVLLVGVDELSGCHGLDAGGGPACTAINPCRNRS